MILTRLNVFADAFITKIRGAALCA